MGRLLCVACRVGIFYAFFNPARKPPQIRCGSSSRVSGEEFRRHLARIAAADLRRVSGSVPQQEKSAAHARTRMGPRPKRLLRRSLCKSHRSSSSEGARSSVTLLARIACEARASATARGGIPKGAQPSLASLCLLSAGQKVGAPRGLSASKESMINLKKHERDQESSQEKTSARSLRSAPQG